jgi:pimeloyl-ACP methyl ester carboxylesterase
MHLSRTELREFRTPDGLTLYGEMVGPPDAPTVVLLHGGGQTRHSWSAEQRLLARAGFQALAYDARGHGDSDWSPDGDYSAPTLAEDLLTVLATLSGPIALIGASMGGMSSFYAVGSAQEKIADALVLVDIVPNTVPAGVERILRFMTAHPEGFATLEEAVTAVAAYNPHRPPSDKSDGLMRNLRLRDDGRLYWHWDPQLLDGRTGSPTMRDFAETLAPRVTLPTLLVRGTKSDILDDGGVAEFQRLLPQLETVTVAGAGHMVVGDDNSNFHEGIIHFIERNLRK